MMFCKWNKQAVVMLVRNARLWSSFLATLFWLVALAHAADDVVEKFPDGKKKAVYSVNADGQKHGPYEEFYADGKRHVLTNYVNGQLHGPYVSHFASGKQQLKASYQKGELHGKYQEYAEDGSLVHVANYRDGKLHGINQEFAKKAVLKDEYWVDGKLVIPKSVAQMTAELATIDKMPVKTEGEFPAFDGRWKPRLTDAAAQKDREAALRILMAYRYVSDVPYKDLVLDRDYIAHAEAGSDLLKTIGKLDHGPPNPGWPEDEYKFAVKGTGSSNIHSGGSQMPPMVHSYMNDSDDNNIKALGHRRWCLNPAMAKTGFGASGSFGCMWSFDGSRKEIPPYEFVAFPARGLTPTASFKDGYSWSVTVNPKKYSQPKQDDVKVSVFPARISPKTGDLEKLGSAMELGFFKVDTAGYGVNNCIIFRPTGVQAAANSAYWVEIAGIKTKAGEPATIEYFVGFFKL